MCKAYHVLLLEVGVHTNHRDLRRGEGTYHGRHVTVSFIRWTVTIMCVCVCVCVCVFLSFSV